MHVKLIHTVKFYICVPGCVRSLHLMYTRLTRLNVVFRGSGASLSVLANTLNGVRSEKPVPTSAVIEVLPLSVPKSVLERDLLARTHVVEQL